MPSFTMSATSMGNSFHGVDDGEMDMVHYDGNMKLGMGGMVGMGGMGMGMGMGAGNMMSFGMMGGGHQYVDYDDEHEV